MALKEERAARLKAYCRMDDLASDEFAVLEGMYDAAVSYMEQAGIREPAAGTPRRAQYDLCVDALVLDAWDSRGTQTAGQAMVDNPAFRRRLNQLKLTEPVSESDTGSGG